MSSGGRVRVRDVLYGLVCHPETVLDSTTQPRLAETGVCYFLPKFNTDDRCPNQIPLLPNIRAHCEVRRRRHGLPSGHRMGT